MPQGIEAPASSTAEAQTSHTQNQYQPTVHELMARVMRDVRNIGKNGRNESQNYSFRGVDDAIGALAQPLRDHGVVMTPEVLDFKTEVRGRQNAVMMRVAFHFHGPAGDKVTAVTMGEGSDFADKASNKAMSAALKYALIHTFMIPVDAKSLDDGDRDHPEGQRSAADAYMERLRKPAVWNNPTALLAMHTEAKADGLLGATVYAPGGEEMTLGELIVSRGTTLKREAAEREERQAAEAPEVAAQVAAETGVSPAAEEDAPPSEAGEKRDASESREAAFARLTEQYRNCWGNALALTQIRLEGKKLGFSEDRVQGPPPESEWTTFDALLKARIEELKAAQGGDTERSAA
jgi:hypothetical protein